MASRSLLFFAAACAVFAAGCSLILSTADPSQCATQADCNANPSFNGRTCEDGFCVVPTLEAGQPSSSDAGPCTSTEDCTLGNSGQASVCKVVGESCTPWQNDICPIITGPWDAGGAIIIGSILPFSVKQVGSAPLKMPYAKRVQQAIDLADTELKSAFPDGFEFPGVAGRHPVAVLHCDSQDDDARAKLAFTHLTQDVGAQVVIVGGDVELAAVQEQASTSGTALVCSDCIGPLPAGNTAWRIAPALAEQAPIASWRVGALESQILAGPTPPSAVKVTVLTEPGAGEESFVTALESTLRFNGKSVSDNGPSYQLVKQEDPRTTSVLYTTHADAILAQLPDVIVVAMGYDFTLHYVDLIEGQWPATKPKPSYVLTYMLYDASAFASLVVTYPDLLPRISGTRTAYDSNLQKNVAGFTRRFSDANNGEPANGNFSGYDAFYALTYGIAAASSQPGYSGAAVSAGFDKLLTGTTVDFGPDGLNLGIPLLASAQTVNVRGLLSSLDWDLTTRDISEDAGMFCFTYDSFDVLVEKPDQGVRYSQSTAMVTGAYTCE